MSKLLRRVAQGETIVITEWCRVETLLTPTLEGSPVERLQASGDVEADLAIWTTCPNR